MLEADPLRFEAIKANAIVDAHRLGGAFVGALLDVDAVEHVADGFLFALEYRLQADSFAGLRILTL